jgi:hypothetical protein
MPPFASSSLWGRASPHLWGSCSGFEGTRPILAPGGKPPSFERSGWVSASDDSL